MLNDLITERDLDYAPDPDVVAYAARHASDDLDTDRVSVWEAIADVAYLLNSQTGEQDGWFDIVRAGRAHRAYRTQQVGFEPR